MRNLFRRLHRSAMATSAISGTHGVQGALWRMRRPVPAGNPGDGHFGRAPFLPDGPLFLWAASVTVVPAAGTGTRRLPPV